LKRKNVSKSVRQKVLDKYGGRCAYCGKELDLKTLRVDHLYPHYLGGEDAIENYMPACYQCNFYKSTLPIEKFREQISTLHERIAKPFITRLGIDFGIVEIKPFNGKFYFEEVQDGFKK
jgi:5-methylcytosine-specific restriction endonuclease McrA